MAHQNEDQDKKREEETGAEDNLKTESEYSESERTVETQSKEDKSTERKPIETDDAETEADVKAAKEAGVDVQEFERTRKALEKANEEAKNRRLKLKEWDELGVDPAKVKQMLQEQRDAEIAKAEEEGRYQDLIDRMRKETAEEKERAQSEVSDMKTQLESYLVDRNLTEAIAAEDGIPKLLQGIAKQYVKTVQDESGEYRTQVVDEDGMPRKAEDGSPMSVRDLVKSFKDDPDLQYAFKAPKVSGAGNDSQASNTPSAKKPGPKPKRNEMSPKEQRAYVKQHGYEAFSQLPRK